MIVTMLRQLTGTRDGVEWPAPGDPIDVPDDEAASLIDLGLAVAAPAGDAPAGRKGARQATNEPA